MLIESKARVLEEWVSNEISRGGLKKKLSSLKTFFLQQQVCVLALSVSVSTFLNWKIKQTKN